MYLENWLGNKRVIELSRIDPTRRVGGLEKRDYELVTQTPLFCDLDEQTVISLIKDGHVKIVERKTTLFVKGEPADRFYVILEGWVKLTRQSIEGSESVISVFTKGETFAEAAMFSQDGYPVSASTVDDCRLLIVPATSVFRAIREDSECALSMIASVSRHMRGLIRQIEQLSVRSSTERLVSFLLSQCGDNAKEATISLPIEKALLAGRLGMQPETLSRSLAKLRDVGVQTVGNQVEIPDVSALKSAWSGK